MDDNVTHRQNFEKLSTNITIEDTFEFTKEEFEKLPIKNKFSAMWNQQYIDLAMFKYSYLAGFFLFLSVSMSELYMLTNYVIIAIVDSSEKRYWYKVICYYIYYIVTAHWLCVLFYNSYWQPNDDDQLILKNKTLWDDYDETLKAMKENRIFDKSSKISTKFKNRMLDYMPDEQTGLRWRFCVICQRDSPPRAHHCVICNKCILKRDHHCFITGRCIGFWNQRYFYFLCLFSLISSIIGLIFEGYYILYYTKIGLKSWWSSLFIFNSVYVWLWTAEIETYLFVLIIHMYLFPLIGGMCFAFICLQTLAILRGITADELKHSLNMKNNSGFIQRWQEVFGDWWLLNFFIPSQILFKQTGDGIQWPGLTNLTALVLLKQSQ